MLTTWIAQRLEMVLEGGRTKPLVIYCVSADNSEGSAVLGRSFVVKALGLPEITRQSLFNEVVGNLLARKLGVETPEPVLVMLTKEFVEAVNGELKRHGLHLEVGIASGSHFLTGMANVDSHRQAGVEVDELAKVYGFDSSVQNPDRSTVRPNCAVRGGRVVCYDFEMCFSFVLALGNHDPCDVCSHGITAKHLFKHSLCSKKSTLSWRPLLDVLTGITKKEIQEIVSSVPSEWQGYAQKVTDHMIYLGNKVDALEVELQRSLV